jgi:hypothetical protein
VTSGRGDALMRTTPGPEVPVLPTTVFFDALLAGTMQLKVERLVPKPLT